MQWPSSLRHGFSATGCRSPLGRGPSQHWGHNDLGRRPGQRHTGVAQIFVSTRPGSWAPPGVSSKTMKFLLPVKFLLLGQSSGKRNANHLTGGHLVIATTMSPTARGTSAPTGGRDLTATAVTSSKIAIVAVALMAMDMAVVVVMQSLKYVPLFRNNWPAHVFFFY